MQKWLNGSEPLKSPDGNLVTFFDNIGRYVIQNYRVWTKKSNLADIISTVVHIILNKKSVLQNKPKLKPINWYEGISPKEIQERMIHFIELQTTEFRKYRLEYLKTLIEIVQCENSLVDIRKNEIEKENACNCSNTLCNSV